MEGKLTDFGWLLDKWQKKHGYSMRAAAERLGISHNTLSSYKFGHTNLGKEREIMLVKEIFEDEGAEND